MIIVIQHWHTLSSIKLRFSSWRVGVTPLLERLERLAMMSSTLEGWQLSQCTLTTTLRLNSLHIPILDFLWYKFAHNFLDKLLHLRKSIHTLFLLFDQSLILILKAFGDTVTLNSLPLNCLFMLDFLV